jgi:tRNA(fMet)-specific endonuclease VapC
MKLGFTDNDLWIAASAIEQGAVLMSDDADYRRISQIDRLVIENWLR